MKTFFLLITAYFHAHVALAQTARPLIQAAGTSPQAYQQFLGQHSGMTSVTDYLASIKASNDEKIYALADHLEDPADQLLGEIENLHQEMAMSENALLFLRDLLDKAEAKTLSPSQRKHWQYLSCWVDSSLAFEDSPLCKTEKSQLSELQKYFPWAEGIQVENRFIRLQSQGQIAVALSVTYHFQILSNTHKAVHFFGTLAQLKQQSFQPETWISGNCDEFSTTVDDFTLQEQGAVFFFFFCVQSLKNPIRKSSVKRWAQENKSWLYAGGAFVLGAIVYGMKNKKLVIDTSGLQ
ncbi:hypothetical protein D3C87_1164650 [compost metagenome]